MILRLNGKLALAITIVAALAAACAPAGPEPTLIPSPTPPPTATPAPSPVPTATVAPTATPMRTSEGLVFAALADGRADSYYPVAVGSDPDLGQLYVYSSYNETDGQDIVTSLDAGTLRVLNSVRLGGKSRSPSISAQLAVDPIMHRLYAMNPDDRNLIILDGATLNVQFVIHGARRVALAPESGRLYVINALGQIKALSATDYRELASLDWAEGFEPDEFLHNPADNTLYLARWTADDKGDLLVLDGDTLEKKGRIPLSSPPLDMQLDPVANEVYVATNTGLTIVDGAERKSVKSLNLDIRSFNPIRAITLDRGARRLYLSYNAGIALKSGGGLIAVDLVTRAATSEARTHHYWQDLHFDASRNALYALPAMNDALLLADSDGKVRQRVMLGLRLLDMEVDPATGELWTVDSGGSVRVLDGATLQPLLVRDDAIGTPDGAVDQADLAVAQGAVYVSDIAQDVTVGLDHRKLETLQRLKAAGPLAIDHDGQRIFVVDDSVQIFGLGSGKPVGRIVIPQGSNEVNAIGVMWEPVSQRLYVKLRGGVNASVYRTSWRVYDAQGKTALADYNPEYRDVKGIAVFPSEKRLYLAYAGASDWDRGLAMYDVGGAELMRLPGPSGQLLPAPDAVHLYLLRDSGVWVFDREALDTVALLPLSEPYEQMVLDPAGQRLYLRRGAIVAVQPTAELLASGIRSLTHLPESLGLPATLYRSPLFDADSTMLGFLPGEGVYRSTDGGRTWLLSSRGLHDLYVTELQFSANFAIDQTVTATTRNAVYTSTDAGRSWSSSPTWSPAVLFVAETDGRFEIQAMNSDGSQVRRLGKDGTFGWQPSWAPDDEWLAFAATRDGNSDIYVIQVDGYGLARATNDPADDTDPAWSPDGSRIAFTSTRDGNPEVYVMDADGGNPTRMTDDPSSDHEPAWSPDGTRLAFTSNRSGHEEIYLLTPVSRETITLTTGSSASYNPAWSRDGRWIAFASESAGNADIWRVRPDGTEMQQITDDPAADKWPAWLPDSRSLVFSSNRSGRFQLYAIDLSGGVWKRLRNDPAAQIQPSYVP